MPEVYGLPSSVVATGVVVSDTLPAGVSFASASGGCSLASGTVTCGPTTMPADTVLSFTLVVTPTAAAVGTAAVAVAFNSLNFSSADGFLCQVYGTAALAFGLAFLPRLLAPANWRR